MILFLLLLCRFPAVENNLSDGTLVAGRDKSVVPVLKELEILDYVGNSLKSIIAIPKYLSTSLEGIDCSLLLLATISENKSNKTLLFSGQSLFGIVGPLGSVLSLFCTSIVNVDISSTKISLIVAQIILLKRTYL